MASLESLEQQIRVLTEAVGHLTTAIEELSKQGVRQPRKPLDFSMIPGHQSHS